MRQSSKYWKLHNYLYFFKSQIEFDYLIVYDKWLIYQMSEKLTRSWPGYFLKIQLIKVWTLQRRYGFDPHGDDYSDLDEDYGDYSYVYDVWKKNF